MPKRGVRFALILCNLILLTFAIGFSQSRQHASREFVFQQLRPGVHVSDETEPNGFLNRHQSQMAYPGNPDKAFIQQMMRQAFNKQSGIKFRGKSQEELGRWFFLGPEQMEVPDTEISWEIFPWESAQGRLTDLAIDQQCKPGKCRLWVGSAAGGLWRTDRALAAPDALNWRRVGAGLGSANIGAITIDPNDPKGNTIYVGTGESNFNMTSAAGEGLFKSTDGGDSFQKVSTFITDLMVSPDPIDFTLTRGISQVAVHPSDPDTIYVSTTTAMLGMTSVRGGQSTITGGPQGRPGLYRTTDGGQNWELLMPVPVNTFSGSNTPEGLYEISSGVKEVRLDPVDPETVYISVLDDGIYRMSPSLEGGDASFKLVFKLQGSFLWSSYAAFDLARLGSDTRIYVYNGIGFEGANGALYRVDDANVPAADLATGGVLSPAWMKLSSPDINNPQAYVSNNLCAGQCVYDLFVESPDGHPDTVYIGGNFTKLLFDPVLRSTDAGETFTGAGYDLQSPTGSTHVDVRAAVFHPQDPGIVFVAGDGGLTRTDGLFGNGSHLCQSYINRFGFGYPPGSLPDAVCQVQFANIPNRIIHMNKGLVSMQLYNVAGDPRDPLKRIIAGTQDNSTHIYDGTKSAKTWQLLFGFGDGTAASGFHNEDPSLLFASFQSNWFFVNFRNGGKLPGMTVDGRGEPVAFSDLPATASWLFTSAPIIQSGERNNPTETVSGRQFITFDPIYSNTQFTGYESVWRTQNNGGDQAFLEQNCTLWQVFFTGGIPFNLCGDWRPLGVRLSSGGFGDRSGGVVAAAERGRDADTLWAGTSLGRVFVTKNVNDADPGAVQFVRVDNSAGLPNRFVSGITVDDEDPNVAYLSYSGFSAVAPGGHVYRVTYDPMSGSASAEVLDYNLPDYPINHIVLDDLTGDLYVSNDFGVLRLADGDTEWQMAAEGLPTVLVPHMEIHPQHRKLLIGTHGLGAWYINLEPVEPATE